MNIRRACIYAHFDPEDKIDEHVVYQLTCYSHFFDKIIFVSTGCSVNELSKIKDCTTKQIIRENKGYDFLSWKTGLKEINLDDFEEVVWTNDSVYGPLFPLEEMFSRFKNYDFAGVSESREVKPHLQSYFLVFKKSVLLSQVFQNFLSEIQDQPRKKDYVTTYEVELSLLLKKAGFVHQAIYSNVLSFLNKILDVFFTNPILNNNFLRYWIHPNPTLYKWKEMLQCRAPFIKTNLFKNHLSVQQRELAFSLIEEKSDYPTLLIRKHLQRLVTDKQ